MARTADELRLARSVLLPLKLWPSIEPTAQATGRSSGATRTMHTRFGKVASGVWPHRAANDNCATSPLPTCSARDRFSMKRWCLPSVGAWS